MKTIFLKPKDITKKWYLIDAENAILGRVAVKVADVVRGRHEPTFAPNMDMGNYVVVINAAKLKVTGGKEEKKIYYRHSGRPGGLKAETYRKISSRKPTFPLEQAIKGMLPHGPLGWELFRHVKIYSGAEHRQDAQKPIKLEV